MNQIRIRVNVAFLFFFIMFPILAYSQNQIIQFKNHTIDNGLSQSVVKAVYVDENGVAWIGTDDGLNRYDGYSYQVFKPQRNNPYSLSYTGITLFLGEDSQNNLWILTSDLLLNKFNLKTNLNETYGRDLPDSIYFNRGNFVSMTEDNNSDLWFTNLSGLYKYIRDKNEFIRYSNDPKNLNSLPSNKVWAITRDSENKIWIGTSNGISLYLPDKDEFKNFLTLDSASFKNEVAKFIIDENNDFYAISRTGIYKYDYAKDDFSFFEIPTISGSPILRVIVDDKKGSIWISANYGLFRFDKLTSEFTHITNDVNNPKSISANEVYDIYLDDLGKLWFGTENGLDLYDFQNKNFTSYFNSGGDKYSSFIYKIQEDYEHNLWVLHYPNGYGASFSRFNRNTGIFENLKHNSYFENSATSDMVYGFSYLDKHYMPYRDRFKNLWFGSFGGGVSQYAPKLINFEKYVYDPFDKDNINGGIWGFCEDKNGLIWISEIENGLAVFDKQTGKVVKRFSADPKNPNGIQSNWILSINIDNNGLIWFTTREYGIYNINPDTYKITHFSAISEDPILSKYWGYVGYNFVDNQNNLWIFMMSYGLIKYNIETDEYKHITFKDNRDFINNDIFSLYEDSKGFLWIIGTFVQKYDKINDKFIEFPVNENQKMLPFESVLCCLEDKNGNMWFGSSGKGICKYNTKDETLDYYDEIDGLSNNFVYGIVEDENGCLWFSTNNGISKFDPEKIEFKVYDFNDGLQSNEFNANAYFKDSDGKIYFGGLTGFNCFYPNDIKIDTIAPIIILSNLSVLGKKVEVLTPDLSDLQKNFKNHELIISNDNKFYLQNKLEYTDTLILSYRQKSISFEMTGLGNNNPAENIYKYKLNNFDNDWVYSDTRRFVSYTNLPAGEYIFEAYSANSDGVWSKKPATLFIKITPPFWQTWWFRILVVIVSISVIYFVYVLKVRQIKRRNEELERLVKIRTNEIHMKNVELEQQKEEITSQRDEIELQRDDIEGKAEILRETNKQLVDKNEEIRQQKEEIESIAEELKVTNKQIQEQTSIIKKSHNQITESINYALRIQQAVLTPLSFFKDNFSDFFILFKPRDIVSGDFYWGTKLENKIIVTAADCTGHGVPGAFMSMLGVTMLNQIVNEGFVSNQEKFQSADILNILRTRIIDALGHGNEEGQPQEGMDMTLIIIDSEQKTIDLAGAYNPLLLVSDNELIVHKTDRLPVGYHFYKKNMEFSSKIIDYKENDKIYLFSDGFADQFGSSEDKKLSPQKFRELIKENSSLSMSEQKQILDLFYQNWIESGTLTLRQIDDVLVMGLEL
ncbi:MAG: SpoIIE family protein phosphatase [Bacteroidales bacterium]|nr:SpoIIE family protein phosphatase [Bacteroidales bacterium]